RRSKISNRRPLNRFEAEQDSEKVSTSAKKLKSSKFNNDVPVDDTFGYRILHFAAFVSAISACLVCRTCGKDVILSETNKRGLGFKVIISCGNCEDKYCSSSPYIKNGYEINKGITFVMRILGIGLQGMKKFCAFMDLAAPIFYSFYDSIVQTIAIATDSVRFMSMKQAAKEEKEISITKGQTHGIMVSGDGSWRKRGYSSLYRIVTLIGYHTAKVIDIIVKSKYCKSCEYWEKHADSAEYEEWATTHTENCQSNHSGSAGKIEVDGVLEMFQRLIELHDVKYTNYIDDGDSTTFKGVTDSKPYGDIIVKKKECIAHIQKRMGTCLRNLKKSTKGLCGKGKLTGKLIDELTIYCGLSIRRNANSVENMKKEIWATLYHKLSTDENSLHGNCPQCANSWCSWQEACAENNLNSYKHKPALPIEVFNAIKPIYEDLSRDDLLERCLGGYNQNNNECFNSILWNIAPKNISSGKKVLDIATDVAVCTFNDGLSAVMKIMEVLQFTIGSNCYNFCVEADAARIRLAEVQMSDAAKEARSASKSTKKAGEYENTNTEGQLYGAGIAD
ncbi:hypothetical protein ALC57_13208, partial [Trachymyrmex cornetzi]